MTRVMAAAIVLATVQAAPRAAGQDPPTTGAVFVAYYWHAKPGQIDAYNEYIRTVAVPIDEDARKAGVFEEVRTVMPGPGIAADWTHLRIFRLKEGLKDAAAAQSLSAGLDAATFRVKSADAARALGAGLDAATARIVPDEARRKANSERAATLRDFVRQEIWTEMK